MFFRKTHGYQPTQNALAVAAPYRRRGRRSRIRRSFARFLTFLKQIPSFFLSLPFAVISYANKFSLDTFRSWISATLSFICWPFLRLELLSAITYNRKLRAEAPKEIVKHNRWKTSSICLIHLIPITITAVLLFLNFSNLYFEAVGSSNQSARLNALQFAAKMHEILIVTSLSAIVLNCVQYELLYGRGVTLGSLLVGFQITDISSLWSPGLWATVFASGLKIRRFMLILLVVLAVVLGAVVGPASAILMLPSVDWWSYQPRLEGQWFENYDIKNPRYFIGANESTLWPNYVNAASFPSNCSSMAEPVPAYCPLGGVSSISTVFELEHMAWVLESTWNFTTEILGTLDLTYNRYIEGASGLLIANKYIGLEYRYLAPPFLTQTTPLFADNLLVAIKELNDQINSPEVNQNRRWILSLSNGSQVLAPAAYATCSTTGYNWRNGSLWEIPADDDGDYSQTTDYGPPLSLLTFPTFPLDSNQTWISDASPLLEIWNNSTEIATLWVEPPDFGDITPSIGVVFAAFLNLTEYSNLTDLLNGDSINKSAAKIVTCSVFASWQPVEIYIDPFTDSFIHSPSIDFPSAAVRDSNYLANKGAQAIKFDIDWANLALPPNDTVGLFITKLINVPEVSATSNTGDDEYIGYTDSSWNIPMGISLSIFIADVMSRIGMEGDKMVGLEVDEPSPTFEDIGMIREGSIDNNNNNVYRMSISGSNFTNNTTEFQVTLLRYGYGYSMDGLTRRLAAGILLTHVLMGLIYMILVVWFGWTCHGLRSPFEVVVLAINSPSTEILDNTCAGVSRLDTYRHIVKVGEVSDTEIGLILNKDKGISAPVVGKKYGS
jgi:hypothetical protein